MAVQITYAGGAASLLDRARLSSRVRAAAPVLAVGIVGFSALLSRRPDVVSQPSLYAEDGQTFLADALNGHALQHLLTPLGGYLVVFQRIIAMLVSPLGLTHGATALALIGMLVQVAPAVFLVTPRCRSLLASDLARVAVAALYLTIPNQELTANLTNAQWHLAALAVLVMVSAPPRGRVGHVFDLAVLVLAGLSGPYALILAPIAAVMHRHESSGWRRVQLATLTASAVIQLALILPQLAGHARESLFAGASPRLLVYIITNQFLVRMADVAFIRSSTLPLAVALAAGLLAVLLLGAVRGPRFLRWFILFAVAVAALGLAFPYGVEPPRVSPWADMAVGGSYSRYFFFFAIALVLSAAAGVAAIRRPSVRRALSASLVAAVAVAAILQWQYPAATPQHLAQYEMSWHALPRGAVVTVPIAPSGWTMQLRAQDASAAAT